MKNCTVIQHPVVQHHLGQLRNKETTSHDFRSILRELAKILAYEGTKNLSLRKKEIETPIAKTEVSEIADQLLIVSIMRAGNGLLDSLMDFLPFARVGHIGIYRDKFVGNTVEYYFKLPNPCQGNPVLIAEPMLATGDTIVASIDRLKKYNVGPIKVLSVLVSEEGLKRLAHFHPDVEVLTLSIEESLNEKGYLVPGLGDAGDRIYHTK